MGNDVGIYVRSGACDADGKLRRRVGRDKPGAGPIGVVKAFPIGPHRKTINCSVLFPVTSILTPFVGLGRFMIPLK